MAAAVSADDIAVAISQDSATVGDIISFDVRLDIPKGFGIVPPETVKGFGDFRVLSLGIDTVPGRPGTDGIIYRYGIATYKPQNCTIPPLRFLLFDGSGDSAYDTLTTPPVPVRIISVIPEDAPDSARAAIKDLKAQQRAGGSDIRSLWALLAVALLLVIYYLWEKFIKKDSVAALPDIPLMPPYEEAMEAIVALEAKGYITRGNIRDYVFELSDIFKRYVGRRYNTIAPELTTEEIVSWLEYSGISREMRMCAEWFLRTSDQVKFAKWTPDSQTLNRLGKEVCTFLEATKPNTDLEYEKSTQRMGAVE